MMSLTQEHNSMTHQSFEPPSLDQDSSMPIFCPECCIILFKNSQHLTKATFMSDRFDFLLTCLICWRKNSPSLTSWGKFLANFSHGEKYSGKHCYIDQLNNCKYKKMQEGTNTTNLLKSSRFSVIVVNGPKYQTVQVSRDPHKHFAKTGSPVIFLATSSLWKNSLRWDLCTY